MKNTYYEDSPSPKPVFNFNVIAKTLSRFLLSETKGAKILGIHGRWGSGKSTLMTSIRNSIAEQLNGSAVFVEFNAWKFEQRHTLWRALILHVLGELRKFQQNDNEFAQMEQSLYRAFEVEERGPWRLNWSIIITEVLAIVFGALQLGFVGKALRKAPAWVKAFFLGGENAEKDAVEAVVDSERVEKLASMFERTAVMRHVEHVQSVEQFLCQYRTLIKRLRDKDKQVFVLIDDLDRCLPETALEIFEAIKLFLDAKGCSYIVCLDRDVIRKGLALRYAAPGQAAQGQAVMNADEYIEKTISLSFDVPRLSDEDVEELSNWFDLPLELDGNIRSLILAGVSHNPRRVKRFLNTLSLNLELAADLENATGKKSVIRTDDRGSFAIFLKLLIISYRYSGIFSLLFEDGELVNRLQKLANADAAEEDRVKAREARICGLKSENLLVQSLNVEEDFWRLMAHPPNLLDNRVKKLLSWFRIEGASEDPPTDPPE